MKKYTAKFLREFEVEVQADSMTMAQMLAMRILGQLPFGSVKIVSITAEDYIEPVKQEKPKIQMTPEERRNTEFAAKVKSELDRPRMPGGLDDLDVK
jgi:hypothetical protein